MKRKSYFYTLSGSRRKKGSCSLVAVYERERERERGGQEGGGIKMNVLKGQYFQNFVFQ